MASSPSGAIGCELTEDTTIEDNGCTLTNSLVCNEPDYVTEMVIITTQQDEASSLITGVTDVKVFDRETGDPICRSTYDIEYTRQ